VPLAFQQRKGIIRARLHDASLTLRERQAVFRQRKAAQRLKSAGNRPVVRAGTHTMALRAVGECAARAYRAVVSAPEGSTRAHTRGHRDHMRGQTGQANGWCVCRHRGGRRPASTWPDVWASRGSGQEGVRGNPSLSCSACIKPRHTEPWGGGRRLVPTVEEARRPRLSEGLQPCLPPRPGPRAGGPPPS
jgi:hypothetical protein